MMNRAKVIWSFIALLILTGLFSAEASAGKRIGILMFSEEPRYRDSIKGLMDQLKKEGFREPTVKYTVENARESKARAVEVAQRFAAQRMDLIVTLGTTATIAAAREAKDVPVVFSMVYDPVEAGIAGDWKSSGNNTTGASTLIPMSRIVKTLKEFAPVKRLAVLYTPGEKNSEAQLLELQKIQNESQMRVMPVILFKREEVPQALADVVTAADAIYLTGSRIVGATVPLIVEMANRHGVVTITHLEDLVEKGALLGVCPDPYLVGRLAGRKAAKVLAGAKPSSIPIEPVSKFVLTLNRKTARAGEFRISPAFMKKVTKIVE
jgi:putative ABC transport system substrate-binding protein